MSRHLVRGALAASLLAVVAVSTAADRAPSGGAPIVVTITATNYAFDVADTLAAGATTLRLVNDGTELHHASLVRLEGGRTLSDLFAAMRSHGRPPAWAIDMGGPNVPAPGRTSEATVVLEPGTYAILCFIPAPDGQPHVMKGMAKQIVVVPAKGAIATLPAADVQLTLRDYGFDFSAPLTAGRHNLLVRNAADQPHEVVFVKLAPGKSVHDVVAWAKKMEGPPPGDPIGGTVGLATGRENLVPLDLSPGEYGLLCFVPDAKDGKSHVAHGMVSQFTVR
jgi:uncharacterized cupredoxin-like copper-binding protein